MSSARASRVGPSFRHAQGQRLRDRDATDQEGVTVDVGLGLHLREEADYAGGHPEATAVVYLRSAPSVQSMVTGKEVDVRQPGTRQGPISACTRRSSRLNSASILAAPSDSPAFDTSVSSARILMTTASMIRAEFLVSFAWE
jgi:hypothetical protein